MFPSNNIKEVEENNVAIVKNCPVFAADAVNASTIYIIKPRIFKGYDIKFKNCTNKIIKIIYSQDHIIKDNESDKINIGIGSDSVDFSLENTNKILSFNEKIGIIKINSGNSYPLLLDKKGIYFTSYFYDDDLNEININENVYLEKGYKYIFEQDDINTIISTTKIKKTMD